MMKVRFSGLLTIVCLMISGFNSLPAANAAPVIGMMQPLFRFDVTPGVEAQVSLQETRVMIQTPPWPPVQVTSLNIPLLRQWSQIYFKVDDYDRDGMNDLAILQSVGRVGTERCYGIYRYNPATKTFRPQKSFDRCGI